MQKAPKPGKSALGTRLAKMSNFSSDLQTLFKHLTFPLYFLYELLMSLRSQNQNQLATPENTITYHNAF